MRKNIGRPFANLKKNTDCSEKNCRQTKNARTRTLEECILCLKCRNMQKFVNSIALPKKNYQIIRINAKMKRSRYFQNDSGICGINAIRFSPDIILKQLNAAEKVEKMQGLIM